MSKQKLELTWIGKGERRSPKAGKSHLTWLFQARTPRRGWRGWAMLQGGM